MSNGPTSESHQSTSEVFEELLRELVVSSIPTGELAEETYGFV